MYHAHPCTEPPTAPPRAFVSSHIYSHIYTSLYLPHAHTCLPNMRCPRFLARLLLSPRRKKQRERPMRNWAVNPPPTLPSALEHLSTYPQRKCKGSTR